MVACHTVVAHAASHYQPSRHQQLTSTPHRWGLVVIIIFRSGLLQVTNNDPSVVGNRTMRIILVSTILTGATPVSVATFRIVFRHSSKLMDFESELLSAPPGEAHAITIALVITNRFIGQPLSAQGVESLSARQPYRRPAVGSYSPSVSLGNASWQANTKVAAVVTPPLPVGASQRWRGNQARFNCPLRGDRAHRCSRSARHPCRVSA